MPNQKAQESAKENIKGNVNKDDALTSDDMEQGGAVYSKNLMGNRAEEQVRETEDASLQDDSYAFDSDNIGNEDIHDISDFEGGAEEDYLQ